MKDEIIIPTPKEEDFVAANKRRDNYALKRDLQASEFNGAIASRLLIENKNQLKCGKCGKEFSAGQNLKGDIICPECK
jgi:predicted Zn-ribbon and HTH transcriptional regulator